MKTFFKTPLLFLNLLPALLLAQKPEKQISFALESKPHTYYVQQAELWALEVQKDSLSENAWYNYFRACRNAHGSADWRSDFVKESPYLKMGDSMMYFIKKYIPNTFTFYYLAYLNQGIGTENSQDLLKAYQMNPDFEGIHSSMISYAESSMDRTLRKQVNETWFKTNYLSGQLLNYGYNVLMSLDSNAVLFTQHDNDTYPLWMLQDALKIRTDVTVINIDFLLLENYRKQVYQNLKIPELELKTVDIDEYHSNWRKVLTHVLSNYKSKAPVYLSMTVADELYKDFEKQLFPSGLAFRFSRTPLKLDGLNRRFYEKVALLDYLQHYFSADRNQRNVDYQNLNYLNCFELVYKQYVKEKKLNDARRIKDLSLLLATRIGNPEYVNWVEKEFK